MMDVIELSYEKKNFNIHVLKGKSNKLVIFLPGLGEPKAGLFYIWTQMAFEFNQRGHHCILLDLAGQGDSFVEFSFQNWMKQLEAVTAFFSHLEPVCIARGLSVSMLPKNGIHAAIHPPLKHTLLPLIEKIRWIPSPFKQNFITPAFPQDLTEDEKKCFHLMGAEAECIGGLQVPASFVSEVEKFVPIKLPHSVKSYRPENFHALFDKAAERKFLTSSLIADLGL